MYIGISGEPERLWKASLESVLNVFLPGKNKTNKNYEVLAR